MKSLLFVFLLLLSATTLFGQAEDRTSEETRIAKESSTTDGDRGLFTIPSVETLNKGQFSFGAGWNNTARTPRSLEINTGSIYFSYGALPRLTVTATLDAFEEVKAGNLSQPGFDNQYPFVTNASANGFGDTYLSAKYRLWRQGANNVGGISLKGFVKLGTASATKGLGTGTTDAGADIVFTSVLPFKFILDSTIGYTLAHNATDPYAVRLKSQLRSAVGAAWPATGVKAPGGVMQGIFEYSTLTFVGAPSAAADPASVSVQDSSDVAGGFRYMMLNRGIAFSAGYRNNVKFDTTFPGNKQAVGFVAGLSYSKPVARSYANNHWPVIALEADPMEIPVGGSSTITATGFDADNDPLTYSWFAASGRIIGSGEKVTFNAAGLQPGTYTVSATASDGKGGTATAQIDITVKQ